MYLYSVLVSAAVAGAAGAATQKTRPLLLFGAAELHLFPAALVAASFLREAERPMLRHRPTQSASAPVSPVIPRREGSSGGMRRAASSHAIIQLSESAPYMAAGWCFDTSKKNGHYVCTEEGVAAALCVAACSLWPSSNEFWNVMTECVRSRSCGRASSSAQPKLPTVDTLARSAF